MDTLEKRVRTLFGSCRRGEVNTDQAQTEFADIKRGYNKTLEEADEKVALATQMYDLVDRYVRRLGWYFTKLIFSLVLHKNMLIFYYELKHTDLYRNLSLSNDLS